jgi:hypothetical protein
VTVVAPTSDTYVTIAPSGDSLPVVSNVNLSAGDTIANLAIVKLGTGGSVQVENAFGDTDVLADVVGWYDDGTSATGGRFNSLSPVRLVDTRRSMSTGSGETIDLQVAGVAGLPIDNVSAVVLNVTATGGTETSYLTAWPHGGPRPDASNLNFDARETVPNLVVAGVESATGMVSLYNAHGMVDVIVDLVGWYDRTGEVGSLFTPLSPTRLVDTRSAAAVEGALRCVSASLGRAYCPGPE